MQGDIFLGMVIMYIICLTPLLIKESIGEKVTSEASFVFVPKRTKVDLMNIRQKHCLAYNIPMHIYLFILFKGWQKINSRMENSIRRQIYYILLGEAASSYAYQYGPWWLKFFYKRS